MADLTDISDFINRATGGSSGTPEALHWMKDARVAGAAAPATIAGRLHSLWAYDGNPAAGATPGGWSNPTNATDGGLKQADPGGGREKWMTFAGGAPLAAGTLLIYDRLGHIGTLVGNDANAQTFTGTITRNTGGVGNFIWLEIATQIGTTGTTVTCSYTDQGGNSGQTSPATVIGGTGFREATRIIEIPLASGDNGVQALANIDIAATTGTAGAIVAIIARPLLRIPMPLAGVGGALCLLQSVRAKIDTDACIAMAWEANGTTAPQLRGSVFSVEA